MLIFTAFSPMIELLRNCQACTYLHFKVYHTWSLQKNLYPLRLFTDEFPLRIATHIQIILGPDCCGSLPDRALCHLPCPGENIRGGGRLILIPGRSPSGIPGGCPLNVYPGGYPQPETAEPVSGLRKRDAWFWLHQKQHVGQTDHQEHPRQIHRIFPGY